MAKSRTAEGQTTKLRFQAYDLYVKISNAKKARMWEVNPIGEGFNYQRIAQDELFRRLDYLERQAHRRWGRRCGPQYEYGTWLPRREWENRYQAAS